MASRAQPIYAKYTAVNVTTGKYVSGDLANHTLFWVKDGTGATPTNAPTEPNSTGTYQVLLTSTEATCNDGIIIGTSSTANVVLVGVAYTFEQLPTAAAGTASTGLPLLNSAGNVPADVQTIKTQSVTAAAGITFGTTVSTYAGGAVASVTGNVGGSVASVAGAVGSVTGNVGGNVTGSVGSVAGNVGGTINGFTTAALLSLGIITAGTAQAGGANTITLAAGEANVNNAFSLMGASIVLTSGTSSGQSSFITGYVGSTKVATVSPAWQIGVPGNGTKYVILPGPSQFTGAMLTQLNAATPQAAELAVIQAKTDLIATNAADSPNEVTAQGTVATINGQTSQLKFNGVGLVEAGTVFDQTSPAVAATGTFALSAIPSVDGTASVQISDGTTSVVFAFTSNGPQGVSVATVPGDIVVTLENLAAAIQANLTIIAPGGDSSLPLTNSIAGAAGNVDIVLTDNTGTMSATGMSGGLDAVVTYDAINAQPATPTNITAASGVTLTTIDGIDDARFRKALLGFMGGTSSVVNNGNGTSTVTFHAQDGTTPVLTVTFNNTTSARTVATIA